MADMKTGSSSTKTEGSMTKKEAVERGLKTLGSSATPTQLQKHIREQYKIEMDLKHISTAKAKIMKAASPSKPAVAKSTGTTSHHPQPMAHGKGIQGIHLKDIETVKELVERVGATSLKKLIDVMAR